MKTSARVFLLLFAGLTLAGCVSKTGLLKEKTSPTRSVARADEPVSGRDYWMMRDIDDRLERVRDNSANASSR